MQVTIDEQSGGGQGEVERFEELKLDTGEVARFMIPVKQATAEYVHELKPVLIVNGVIQMETKTKKDKSTFEVPATGFKGRKVCTGIVDIPNSEGGDPLPGPMRVKGLDPENCIMCAAAADGIASLKPEIRYAVPIIRIATTKKNSTDIQDPPGAKILVLPLTWRQYRDLATNLGGIRELYGWGPEHPVDPTMADICVEAEDGEYKRYKWRTPMRSHWRQQPGSEEVRNPALRALVFGLWSNPANRPTAEQLQAACGKAGDLVFLQQDLGEVVDSYAQKKRIESGEVPASTQHPAASAQAGGATDLGDGLTGLDDLDAIIGGGGTESAQPAAAAAAPPAAQADSLDGLEEFGVATTSNPSQAPANGHAKPAAASADDLLEGAQETAQPAAVTAAAVAAAPAEDTKPDSFDTVWDEL